MKNDLIFQNCHYFNESNCPGLTVNTYRPNPGLAMPSKETIIYDFVDGKPVSMDMLDFIRQHGEKCTACLKYKTANPK